MLRFLQLNLNHCEAAQSLLAQTIRENNIDVALISEQYKTISSNKWVQDKTGKAAVWVCGSIALERKQSCMQEGFAYAQINKIHLYSCYAPPSLPIDEFEEMLDRLTIDTRGKSPVIISGDFNAWATEWGSVKTTRRGQLLLEAFASLDLVLVNCGTVSTYTKNGTGSIIDLTFASSSIAHTIVWRVSELYTHSDHHAITFEMRPPLVPLLKKPIKRAQKFGWKEKDLDVDMLKYMLEKRVELDGTACDMVEISIKYLRNACDASMPRKIHNNRRPPVYWWNDAIGTLRAECHKLRRKCHRSRNSEFFETLQLEFKLKRKEFKKAIAGSKRQCFQKLIEDVQNNPWGSGYRIVMKKIKSCIGSVPDNPATMANIVESLFPRQDPMTFAIESQSEEEHIPPVTTDEVLFAVQRIGKKKAPGLDGIPNIILKMVLNQYLEEYGSLFSKCLNEKIFPDQWKRQRLVLIPKGSDKNPESPSSYRPLCMIDTIGKVFERIICERLEMHIEEIRGLSDNQYGFRKKRSTIDAIAAVCDIARKAIAGKRWKGGEKEYCVVVTLDVKNAFNTANWSKIMKSLSELRVPEYLVRTLQSYFENRVLLYDTREGVKYHRVTGGVPQGSVLGPTLWNIMYDGILRIEKPHGSEIIGYADDIAVVVVAKTLPRLQQKCNRLIQRLKSWLQGVGLELADHKTEVLLISSRKKVETIEVHVGGLNIKSKPSLKYLGVILDHRLCFKEHLKYVSRKATENCTSLSRLLPNIGGPRQEIRKLLVGVNTSIIMYAAPIWWAATHCVSYLREVSAVYRLASLRVCCAFRTVSSIAVGVIAGRMPVDLLAKEAAVLNVGNHDVKIVRDNAVIEWQRRWDAADEGRWTYRLIPNIKEWVERKHGQVTYHLMQFLSGHGCFRTYLYKYKHVDSPFCLHCTCKMEDAEHVLIECVRFDRIRSEMEALLLSSVTPNGVVRYMLESTEAWDRMNFLLAKIMVRLREDERSVWRAQNENPLVPTIAQSGN